ncbi:MAG: phosphoribosylglycinamide formyltransferase [Gammaproteobacteria bacterium]
MTRLVVLISGRGSNLVAIANAIERRELDAEIVAVISSRPQALGLEEARNRAIPALVVDHRDFDDRQEFDRALAEKINEYRPDWVVLAGFMRILSAEFIARFPACMTNIHPSLLPAYPGLETHKRALADGVSEHGATVHLVSNELDGGPVLGRVRVPLLAGDTEATLADRVLHQEHRLYPRVLQLLVSGRLRWDAECEALRLDGEGCDPVEI